MSLLGFKLLGNDSILQPLNVHNKNNNVDVGIHKALKCYICNKQIKVKINYMSLLN